MYGGTSGLFSGAIMTLVTAMGYKIVRNPRNYKVVMGAITTFVTGGIFFGFGLWELGSDMDFGLAWLSALVMSIVIAVYASQMTARKYINEISVQKEKVKTS